MAKHAGGSPPKTIDLHLTRGGIAILKNALPQPAWYEGLPLKIALGAISVQEGALVDHSDSAAEGEDPDAWAAEKVTITVPDNEREALKACVDKFLKKGALKLTKHVAVLCHELGLE